MNQETDALKRFAAAAVPLDRPRPQVNAGVPIGQIQLGAGINPKGEQIVILNITTAVGVFICHTTVDKAHAFGQSLASASVS